MHMFRLIALVTAVLLLAWPPPAAAEHPMAGTWRINLEETDKVSADFDEGSGIQGRYQGRTTITVMGLPLPSRAKASPMSNLAARDPLVLTCTQMNLALKGNKEVILNYDNGERETLRHGEYRGRTTRISNHKLEQRYKTTERAVRKTWTLREDGRLLVAVRVKYQGDKARTYNRVFDRIDTQAEPAG